ncbi:MAG: glycosyltransferase [Levilactobacillus sp.]|jgi:poly(glycerol-phosphate) alpha-glucosyltransferase|uniref:glycosyltransferase n=1 Tax=Levilactobacillus sp. TaxID=2767919 RepID=UPI002587E8DF|nr:glycosyltransferase [Levilactobacillus sp.]MCH4123095.1 glycosyltransferase [Levilactobacillus sp.]MCI1552767.1 glycosyltransferase [Levilactobacillus sp.]MCI1599593.1 glycosyltransferase [Levilactobacillus sp.]
MFYFINEYILQKNSSVEHTAMNRVKLFNHYKQPAKIVTKTYDRLLHQTIGTFGLTDNEIVNMFDFFQEATAPMPIKVMHTDDLKLPLASEVTVGANFSQVAEGDRSTSNVGFIPGTVGRVFYQEFFDGLGNVIETNLWDWRGFKSATQYFGQNGKLILERYYTPSGKIAMEQYFVPDTNGQPLASRIIVKDYHGRGDLFFQNTDDLFTFFLGELSNQDDTTTTFISDRPGTGVKPLLALNDHSRKYVYLPINHAVDPNDPVHGTLDGFLAPAFEHFNHFDGFITATEQQADHLRQRYPQAKIAAIPAVTLLPATKTTLVTPEQRRAHSLLYVGRIAADKQIEQLLRMFALVKYQVPDATFDLFGYGSADYLTQMTDLVKELRLTTSVTFKDYDAQLADRYDHYQVLVNMATADGAPLAMPEAMGHGIPVVSYPFNYGPQAFIKDGQTGYVIDRGNALAMADKVRTLFTDDAQLTEMSQAAYDVAHQNWTRRKVWNRWQRFVQA